MRIAVLTFDGFNEIDSFVASHILNRVPDGDWRAEITSDVARVTSLYGVVVDAQQPLSFAREADVVLVGSGLRSHEIANDSKLLATLGLDPDRQLIGSQCSGALILAGLGLLADMPVCTDARTRPSVEAAGVEVLDQAFFARGNVASAGGCLTAETLAAWVIWRLKGRDEAERALRRVSPVGEEHASIERVLARIQPYV